MLTWLFNPWDDGAAALIFGLAVAVIALLAAPRRAYLGGVVGTAVLVALGVTLAYMAGAIATAGFGPLLLVGLAFLLIPALAVAFAVVGGVALWSRRRGR